MELEYKVSDTQLGLKKLAYGRWLITSSPLVITLEVLKRAAGRRVLLRNSQQKVEMVQLELQNNAMYSSLTLQPMQGYQYSHFGTCLSTSFSTSQGEVFVYQYNISNIIGVIS